MTRGLYDAVVPEQNQLIIMSGFKLPPDPSTAGSYTLWRKDVIIWKKLTDIAADKRGLALQYACRSKDSTNRSNRIHEAMVNIPEEEVECPEGFDNVLKVLDQLFKIDEKDAELKITTSRLYKGKMIKL